MTNPVTQWFERRSSREKRLIGALVGAAVLIAAPLAAFRVASDYRAEGERRLQSAVALLRDADALAALGPGGEAPVALNAGGSIQSAATAAASEAGLVLSRVEPAGPDAVRISIAPASALGVFEWVSAVQSSGGEITRIVLVRAGDGDLVSTDATVTRRRG
ncbi:hypothetical protein GC169_00500 [bacterium]|nr:hypothetical protein [bacterium]